MHFIEFLNLPKIDDDFFEQHLSLAPVIETQTIKF